MEHISSWSMQMVDENTNTTRKRTEALLEDSMEVGLEENREH
jgi:predicted transcriptional regulator